MATTPWMPWKTGSSTSSVATSFAKWTLFEVLAVSLNVMQDRITRSRMAGDPPDILLMPRLRHLALLEFDRATEAIEEGRQSVARMLPAIEFLLASRDSPDDPARIHTRVSSVYAHALEQILLDTTAAVAMKCGELDPDDEQLAGNALGPDDPPDGLDHGRSPTGSGEVEA